MLNGKHQKRVLVIGGSNLQLPAIEKAKEMGLYVGVLDYNPHAIGIPLADEYFNVSTVDEQGVFKAAKTFSADGIVTLAADMPMRAVAYACNKLGLVSISYDTALKSTDKGEMRRSFEQGGVNHPWFVIIDSFEQLQNISSKVMYPCISLCNKAIEHIHVSIY